ncbi:hypothetical protein AYR54_08175 [Loigolactobacillus backii]|uniref:Uncharacterized protein n=1 Tax=Loigolactobacillus backii TaxID=375175 RepID=A0A192H2Q0_9LACO|nr:hypothetical protein [Loigolactobacillus backii]ANK60332.1 hypothetical protein AYR52_08770 [Loigolactobacillus backii]ANK62226.1 hypothetical protein AYR53_05230 [Loigolactobacillus backii]ANK65213.1 hypothetical protein AYR54_08175 [Loigolactobacillus backii]ANK67771.1 hypothetical protein AYR55_08780 [Loigolactobacillus backii]ANK70759.1 hypothetical protein AYR56_11755 [Loigolactobacillus backii]
MHLQVKSSFKNATPRQALLQIGNAVLMAAVFSVIYLAVQGELFLGIYLAITGIMTIINLFYTKYLVIFNRISSNRS